MITIELIGSHAAVHRESDLTVDLAKDRNRKTTKSAIPVLARKLIAAGHDPQERVHIIRKAMTGDHFIPVFKRDRTLVIWSGVDIIEDVARGPREVKHRPFPGSDTVRTKDTREGAEATETAPTPARLLNAANGNTKSASQVEGEAC